MLRGLMMDRPLLVSSALEYGAEIHQDREIVSVTVEGPIHRYSYGEASKRAAQLAHALLDMGIEPGHRVATLAWNGYRHLELYYAISGIGAVCHTINPRLFPEQMIYIVNHAQDVVLFFDTTFAPLIAKLRDKLPKGLILVAMTDRAHMPAMPGLDGMLCYEDMLTGRSEEIAWPQLDENTAAALCYTSGTTGEPKGALYSHRSNLLHALSCIATGPSGLRNGQTTLPVVPLFHVNAWGLPYAAPIVGTTLVFPGARLDGASLFDLMDAEKVHSAWGVPTVWLGLVEEMRKRGRKPAGFSQVMVGGSAAPKAMIATFEKDYGVEVFHAWGMTEMSPVGTTGNMSPSMLQKPFDELMEMKAWQGRRIFGVDLKIVDDAGRRLPHDGEASGELFVRGPTVISGYFENRQASEKAFDADGWFGTGDVAKITPDGFLIIVDRTKDLIKSGGEWISSIDVENVAMGIAGIAQCAVIGVPHPKWDERPLLVVVKAKDSNPSKQEILDKLAARIAKWQLPDDVVFAEQLPMTATGKVSKLTLRKQFDGYQLPERA